MFTIYENQQFENRIWNSLPKDLLEVVLQIKPFLCGGALTSLFSNSKINDLDFYFTSTEQYARFQLEIGSLGYYKKFNTDNADTYSRDGCANLQLIKKEDCIDNDITNILQKFDFTICMAGYNFQTNDIIIHKDFLYHLAQRKLVFNINASYPIASLYRTQKYIKRGYSLSGTEMVKISLKINSLDLKDYKTLKEQLLGIDTLIFKDLYIALEKKANNVYTFVEAIDMIQSYLDSTTTEETFIE